MNWSRIALALVAGTALVGAQQATATDASTPAVTDASAPTFPSASAVTPAGLTMQTTEPPGGFTGACLLPALIYAPQLPLVCYSPAGAQSSASGSGIEWGATQEITFPAAQVAHSYDSLPSNNDSYYPVATCAPHVSDGGGCPTGLYAISASCCDYGAQTISVDGTTAFSFVKFRSSTPVDDGGTD